LQKSEAPDSLVYFSPRPLAFKGIEVKADGTKVAHVEGYLAVFSGPDDPDLADDYFKSDTDFGLLTAKGEGSTVELVSYYQHGFDKALGRKSIGTCTVKMDEVGLWAEHQIALHDAYTEKLAELAAKNVLGQSSGAVSHLVDREITKSAAGNVASWLKTWPLGEASLTPTPCEPRTTAVSVKALPSLLARDIAAIKSLPTRASVKMDESLTSRLDRIAAAFYDETDGYGWVSDFYDDAVIGYYAGDYYRIGYTVTDDAVEFAARPEWQKVQRRTEWVEAKADALKRLEALGLTLKTDLERSSDSNPNTNPAPPAPTPMKDDKSKASEPNTNTPVAEPAEAKATEIIVTGDLSAEQIKTFAAAGVAVKFAGPSGSGDFATKGVPAGQSTTPGFNGGAQPGETKSGVPGAPGLILKHGRGDNEAKALSAFYKTGDVGAVSHLATELDADERKGLPSQHGGIGIRLEAKADADMGIGTDANGGHLVPEDHYGQIIAKRSESMLAPRLGLMAIPGRGTTVPVPVELTGMSFTATAEAAKYQRDTPTFGQKTMTLLKYTAEAPVSEELLEDEASAVLPFMANVTGRALSTKHNELLVAKVLADGTKFVDLAAAAVAFGDVEKFEGNDILANYLEEDNAAHFLMRASTATALRNITGEDRQYAYRSGGDSRNEIIGYPYHRTNAMPLIGAENKSIAFGNFAAGVGYREGRELVVTRDPFTLARYGQVLFLYRFRTVYEVLNAEAVGYAQHAAA
jgi:HK97 family phage major capsid protein